MKPFLAAYLSAGLAMLAIDAIWLSTMIDILYRPQIGELLAANFRLAPAITFYFLYIAGIVYFAVRPSLNGGKLSAAMLNGALLGVLAYGTYDLTNQATLKTWPVIVTVADMIWGAILTSVAAGAGFLGARGFAR
ncbi:MAG: DUF2177 family protein [Alphaproteobacteria bacterium]|nr:DUF2177 family protein [Alphaproteobacteria bacterium]